MRPLFKSLNLIKTLLFVLLSPVAAHTAAESESFTFVTESYPPYNFVESGKLQGIAVDLLVSASRQTEKPVTANDIHLLPWPRAYKMALEGPDTVLFSTTRTQQREDLFHWVGPITTTRIVLLARASDQVTINSLADIHGYTIGAIRDDVGDQLIRSAGVKPEAIKNIANATSLAKMLAKGRIDLWAYEENVARWYIKMAGLNNANFKAVYTLKESELYYTFSKDIDRRRVKSLQQAIDQISSDQQQYQNIINRYLSMP